jgi:hypothetical protein
MEKSFFAQGQSRITNMTAKTSNAHDLHRSNNTLTRKKGKKTPNLCIKLLLYTWIPSAAAAS